MQPKARVSPSPHHFDGGRSWLGMTAPGTTGFPFATSWWAAGSTKPVTWTGKLVQQVGTTTPSARLAFAWIPPSIVSKPAFFLLCLPCQLWLGLTRCIIHPPSSNRLWLSPGTLVLRPGFKLIGGKALELLPGRQYTDFHKIKSFWTYFCIWTCNHKDCFFFFPL